MDSAELEHLIGFNLKSSSSLFFHPLDDQITVHYVGSVVVVSDLKDAHNQTILRHHDGVITAMDVSPSGEFIATGQAAAPNGLGFPVTVWELGTKKRLFDLVGLADDCDLIAFSPDSKFVAAGVDFLDCFVVRIADKRGFYVWEISSGDLVGKQKVDKEVFTTLSFGAVSESRSRRYATYVICTTNNIGAFVHTMVYDIKSMHYNIQTIPFSYPSRGFVRKYTCASMSPNKEWLFVGTNVGDVVILSVPNSVYRLHLPVGKNGITSVLAGDDSLIVGSGDGFIRTFQGLDTNWVQKSEISLIGSVLSLTRAVNSDSVLALTSEGKLFSIQNNTAVEIAEALNSETVAIAFRDRNDSFTYNITIASCLCIIRTLSSNGYLKLWDINDYGVKFRVQSSSAATCFAFSSDGSMLVGHSDGTIKAFSDRCLWSIEAHRDSILAISTSKLGNGKELVLTAGKDSCVRVWTNRQLVTQQAYNSKPVVGIIMDVIKPNVFHSCSLDRSINSFDLKTERQISSHSLQAGYFTCIAQRSDNEQEIISCTTDGRIILWDPDIVPNSVGSVALTNPCRINAISVCKSSRYFAIGCDDCTVKIFEISSLSLVTSLLAHSAPVKAVAWSPDQRQIVSVAADNTLCVWNFYLD